MNIKPISLILILMLSACAAEIEQHGYSFEQNNIDVIKVGHSDKHQVLNELGSPTTESNYGERIYYYISYKSEKIAFFDPKIIEQRVLAINFDKKDVVSDITEYTIDDLNNIAFSEHKTEIQGNTITPMEQILTNVGKYNKKQKQF